MSFPQTDEQRELVDTVHKLLAETADPVPPSWDERDAGLNRSLWAALASLGLLGLGVDENLGGSGGGLRELCLVAEEIGGVCARAPFVGTAAVLAGGVPDVGTIVDGSLIAVPAWETHPTLRNSHSTALTLSGTTVDGSLQAVAFGMDADALLAYACDTAVIVDLTQRGVRRQPVPAFDVTEPVASVTLREAEAIVVEPGPSAPWIRTVVAAELIGTARRALDGAVQYAKERHQFGRAIGSFQAIKHMLADRYVQVDGARLLIDAAITAVDEGRPGAPAGALAALTAATDAAQAAAGDALQIHGGIGFTWEHPSHVFLKRVRARRSLFGSPAQMLDELADQILTPVS
jgi:alkylation response protein AidB-like acyl-CoA dehydrogenase